MQKHRTRAGGLETTFTAMKGTSCDHLRQAPRRDAPRASSFLPDPAAPPFPGRSPLSPAPSLHCISRVLKLRPSQHKLSEASPSGRAGTPLFSIHAPHIPTTRLEAPHLRFFIPKTPVHSKPAPPSSLGLRLSQPSLLRVPPLKGPRLLPMKTRPFPNRPAPLPLSHAPAPPPAPLGAP